MLPCRSADGAPDCAEKRPARTIRLTALAWVRLRLPQRPLAAASAGAVPVRRLLRCLLPAGASL